MDKLKISILGSGNLGTSIANGLYESGIFKPENITLTRRKLQKLEHMRDKGFILTDDNIEAVKAADVIIVAVEPQHINKVLVEIKSGMREEHLLISVATGVKIAQISEQIGNSCTIIRAMPNTAVAVKESMTCICYNKADEKSVEIAENIFNTVGKTLVIEEELMSSSTALAACGTAFFLRAIRAASQGGIEIGFPSKEAIKMAAQTAKGAATLLLTSENHPEFEVDRVTTPLGCTIAGLNRMEHEGFSSALIKGITTSAEKARNLYKKNEK
ncbi:MAG: pyrroline-5-carboxylate reductase [Victivallales bacterium]|nr:pyrroline-5-carboxylate reductase [Victivallales bacterium]